MIKLLDVIHAIVRHYELADAGGSPAQLTVMLYGITQRLASRLFGPHDAKLQVFLSNLWEMRFGRIVVPNIGNCPSSSAPRAPPALRSNRRLRSAQNCGPQVTTS